jgi:hypothetical protein
MSASLIARPQRVDLRGRPSAAAPSAAASVGNSAVILDPSSPHREAVFRADVRPDIAILLRAQLIGPSNIGLSAPQQAEAPTTALDGQVRASLSKSES